MRPINQCLNSQLVRICQKAFQLEGLQNKLIPLLPENLQPFCQVGSFNKGCLVIITSDAAWASQLRFILPELRDNLRKQGLYQLSSIDIAITEQGERERPKKKPSLNPISENARKNILNACEQMTYQPLKEALKKLGRG
ncbi:DUF721 domain-containing protein [Legionella israelensis]|uniref:DUF721 domain-containing protein n=1 Tax=Legionella israelensis TaxID=454 RepID=A0A0W0WQE9_9GAMM|nr:DUF721 domain-containing protein [Legionella israelensis]KTD34544.1 hypothetical protein Lisr_0088 [Legionella israelensis]QBS09225.1 DUF721 domain-containing protein [Legionella israelensis]SCX98750.1 hypothetical protein SAMN02746069_00902 [Legionella israelensis DSM 19235]STX58969.1 Zn-ribbon-containing, possible RNA-binding protein-like protein [Legionella israelensis]